MSTQNEFDLLKEFGLENLSDEEKKAFQEKILGLIDARFNRAVFNSLNDGEKKELDKLIDLNNEEEISKYIADKVPNYQEIYMTVVADLKEEMMGMKEQVFDKL